MISEAVEQFGLRGGSAADFLYRESEFLPYPISGATGSSGIGPERALEAITQAPRAQRESVPLSELPCERRPGPAEPDPWTHGPPERPIPGSPP